MKSTDLYNVNKKKVALITGFSGQDAYYLTDYLLELGYRVVGMLRRASTTNNWRYKKFENHPEVSIVYGDMTDMSSLLHIMNRYKPDEVYNLAAQSFVGESFNQPIYTAQVDAIGCINLLEACRFMTYPIKVYQASTSELFGASPPPQNEKTPFYPRSPYASAKAYAYYTTVNYREAYGMFASNGILFNHTSSMRGEEFVSRKIVKGLAEIKLGLRTDKLEVGNLHSYRDWGFAGDYVKAMHLILQQDTPDDFVVATGESHEIQEFMDICLRYYGLTSDSYEVNSKYYRPTEVNHLRGDPSKINAIGWRAETSFRQLVEDMCEIEINRLGGNA